MKHLTAHLEDIGESYVEHGRHAMSFAVAMLGGAIACFLHAVFPFLFERTSSECIRCLHDRMVVNRRHLSAQDSAPREKQAA